ncbi:MAG: helix-turn-helix transcriptional regulator [Lachnospiraceae bacterium]|nr:helix-turn-helix transcriptional regulator [Lachnospiraceae bacterium]
MKLDREKINVAMARKSYNITKLAKAYGASPQRMRTILNSRKVSTVTVGKLAEALGCDVTEIIEG